MKRGLEFVLLLLLFVSISFISASFHVGNKSHEITKVYGPGNDIQGWINISLVNEPISSFFKDSEDNSISLIDLLRSDIFLTENIDYNCSIPGCGTTYSGYGKETSKIFSLNAGEEKTLGFRLSGKGITITSINFNITSNAGSNCENQLEIDFFANGEIDYINNKNSSGACSQLKRNGCFNPTEDTILENLLMEGEGKMYCQKIQLSKSPGFKLGAWLEIESGAETTKMAIYSEDDSFFTNPLGECELDSSSTSGDGEERFCEIDYLVKKSKEYYVCIFNDVGTDSKTSIIGYSDTEGCGFYFNGGSRGEAYAYNMSIEGRKFGPIGGMNITEGLVDKFISYIYETYEGSDCSEGCLIPIKFNSRINQEIIIEDISIVYSRTAAGSTIERNIYDLEQVSSTVNTRGHKWISLNNGNFTLPTSFGNLSYWLKLDNTKIFDEKILIERVPNIKYLTPLSTFNKIPTNFKISVDLVNNASIISYIWQFGNATQQTTTTNQIKYAFPNQGIFPVKITVTDTNGKQGTKTFNVGVVSYILYFPERLSNVENNLNNIEDNIANFSSFFKEGIGKTIDIQNIRKQITDLHLRWKQGDREAVVGEFLTLEPNIPESIIEKISTSKVSFYPNINSIELGIINEVLGGDYNTTKSNKYKDAILKWNIGNIDSKIKYNQIVAEYEDGRSEPILNVFELDFTKTGIGNGTIFIKELENIKFEGTLGEKNKSGYRYILLDSGKKIKFYTTQDIGIIDLPVFVSPAINSLSLIEDIDESEEKGGVGLLFFLIIFFLLILGLIVYIILQQWYKHKYETYLFKNRNYLFNLVHYIDTQKKKEVKEGEIIKRLKKSGWTSEQINYVMRKYLGKRTGMLEIPVEKILKIFRKKDIPQPGVMGVPRPTIPPVRRIEPKKGFFKNS